MQEMIVCGEQKRQTALKEYDAKTGLSKRSPNTTRGSSMRSGDRSSVHEKQSSPQRNFSDRDVIPRPDLADIVEDDEERIYPDNDASSEQIYFSPRGASSGGSPMFGSPHRNELAINLLRIDDERAHIPDKKRRPLPCSPGDSHFGLIDDDKYHESTFVGNASMVDAEVTRPIVARKPCYTGQA
jgi:hypothetical protein